MEGNPPVVLNVLSISIGRFSAVPHWPVLGVPRGYWGTPLSGIHVGIPFVPAAEFTCRGRSIRKEPRRRNLWVIDAQ